MGNDNAEWRRRNFDKRQKERDRYKTRRKLKRMGELPDDIKGPMTPEQTMVNDLINLNNFELLEVMFPTLRIRRNKARGISRGATVSSSEKRLLQRARSNARSRKLDFNLEIADIIIPKYCPYLNVELLTEHKHSTHQHYATNDRIDSTMGYVKGNLQIISKLANTMKNNSTEEQLITFAMNVLKIHAPELLM
jgi:hypothetical protein